MIRSNLQGVVNCWIDCGGADGNLRVAGSVWMLWKGEVIPSGERVSGDWEQNPFCARVLRAIEAWIHGEWDRREAVREEAKALGWTEQRRRAYFETILTPAGLARQIDRISESKLRRELARLGAPPPGQLIRDARIEFAKHLLVHGRLLIREVADRAGYENEKHFSGVFMKATGVSPSQYRRGTAVLGKG